MSRFPTPILVSAIALMAAPLPALAVDAPQIVIVTSPPPPESPLDNFRLGMGFFNDPGTSALVGGQAAAFGFDWPLGHGLAVGLDTYNMYRSYGDTSYFMSVNPVQLKYRLGLPAPAPALAPFLTAGTGLSLMGLVGGQAGSGQVGLGLAGSGGVGAVVNETLTLELGAHGGQVASIGYYGWQLRLGTTFKSLGNLHWLTGRPQVAAGTAARPLAGKVQQVAGNRLVLDLEAAGPSRPGDEVLVYYQDEFVVKVARARLVSVERGGTAIAEVMVATEPVKPGYRVRAW